MSGMIVVKAELKSMKSILTLPMFSVVWVAMVKASSSTASSLIRYTYGDQKWGAGRAWGVSKDLVQDHFFKTQKGWWLLSC